MYLKKVTTRHSVVLRLGTRSHLNLIFGFVRQVLRFQYSSRKWTALEISRLRPGLSSGLSCRLWLDRSFTKWSTGRWWHIPGLNFYLVFCQDLCVVADPQPPAGHQVQFSLLRCDQLFSVRTLLRVLCGSILNADYNCEAVTRPIFVSR